MLQELDLFLSRSAILHKAVNKSLFKLITKHLSINIIWVIPNIVEPEFKPAPVHPAAGWIMVNWSGSRAKNFYSPGSDKLTEMQCICQLHVNQAAG